MANNPTGWQRFTGGLGTAAKFVGPAMTAAYIAEPMITTQGSIDERVMAGVGGLALSSGIDVGMFGSWNLFKRGVGRAATSTAGKFMIGEASAARVGSWAARGVSLGASATTLGVSLAAMGAYEGFSYIASQEAARRNGLEWAQQTKAMTTRKAATMRQQSLSLMNRGAMSARSLMGREAQFFHQ